jgi:hypothetical protein
MKHFLIILAVFATNIHAGAQSYAVDWFSLAPGGLSSNAVYSVRGLIAQTDGRIMAGGRYGVVSGFAGVTTIVQEPGAPTLYISRSGTNALISWSAGFTGFVLQRNDSTTLSTGSWIDASLPVITANGTNTVTVPLTTSYAVYRLKR